MSETHPEIERLISRFLDDECSEAERRTLKTTLRRDPAAALFLDESQDLDREMNYALRAAMGRSPLRRRAVPLWSRVGRWVGVGIAASVALVLWLSPSASPERGVGERRHASSWFAPIPNPGDTFVDEAKEFERPRTYLDGSQREWIVIPSDRRGEFLIVEVKRSNRCTIQIQRDF